MPGTEEKGIEEMGAVWVRIYRDVSYLWGDIHSRGTVPWGVDLLMYPCKHILDLDTGTASTPFLSHKAPHHEELFWFLDCLFKLFF